MNKLRNVFIVLALTSGAAWTFKVAVIAANGGAETDGGIISVLWAVGMLSFLLAAATGAALLATRAHVALRVLAGVAGVVMAWASLMILDGVLDAAISSNGWFRDEASLVLAGALMAAAGLRVWSHRADETVAGTLTAGHASSRL